MENILKRVRAALDALCNLRVSGTRLPADKGDRLPGDERRSYEAQIRSLRRELLARDRPTPWKAPKMPPASVLETNEDRVWYQLQAGKKPLSAVFYAVEGQLITHEERKQLLEYAIREKKHIQS